MDIKFGFADTARELQITVSNEDTDQASLTQRINENLTQGGFFELEDEKDRKYIIRAERVVYVEVGAVRTHGVGFMG